jgi:hypothetical protein
MSYNAKVFNIMIASPGDVKSERAIVRDVVYEWNAVHSNTRNIVLLPVGWETHSYPEVGAAPQEIINGQILDKCDLLVGVFWTRIGTPTTEFASGTVEEIEEHVSNAKPAMLYFSSQPVSLDSIDEEQYSELKKFRDLCKSRSLYENFDSSAGFKEKFYRQLQIMLNENSYFHVGDSKPVTEILETRVKIPSISSEAKILLKEASIDRSGTISLLRHLGGVALYCNNKNFIESNSRREVAKWEATINELVHEKLVEARGQKQESFVITNLGYQIAEMIQI